MAFEAPMNVQMFKIAATGLGADTAAVTAIKNTLNAYIAEEGTDAMIVVLDGNQWDLDSLARVCSLLDGGTDVVTGGVAGDFTVTKLAAFEAA